ncbi:MAG: CHAT domain-containing protein [Caldilineaceae bacterium]
MADVLPVPAWLEALNQQDVTTAVVTLNEQNAATPALISELAEAALGYVEVDPATAAHWLQIAAAMVQQLGNSPQLTAPVAYAQARLQVAQGDPRQAESLLLQAQAAWQAAGNESGYQRTSLGMTQVLAMQGRYAEAEAVAQAAIAHLATADPTDFALTLQHIAAHHNLATLLLYQERHAVALVEYEHARQLLVHLRSATTDPQQLQQLSLELAHNELNRATSLTFLDDPTAAESALDHAMTLFDQLGAALGRGHTRTNLGRLYLRTGRYAAALRTFDAAARDLLAPGVTMATAALEQLRPADELLLEHATAYLVMNLLPEATLALAQCERLFRSAEQPYELGQTRYLQGVVALRTEEWTATASALTEATTLMGTLQNDFWRNRSLVAQAVLAYYQQTPVPAAMLLDSLLAASPTTGLVAQAADQALGWDMNGLAEARLLRMRVHLDLNELDGAQQQAETIALLINHSLALPADPSPPWPHLALRLRHLVGRLERARGNHAQARQHLQAAVDLLERQRTTLPVEEIRSAFLDDKSEIYADLVQTFLDAAPTDPAAIAGAFAAVEQARSRALLERLMAAVDATELSTAAANADAQQRLAEVRERLHWLYNQLLGESGSRRLDAHTSQQLQEAEAVLRDLEWRHSQFMTQAQAVDLKLFQAALAPDQQAIVYTMVDHEVLAFVVSQQDVILKRKLATVEELRLAAREVHFQMGRAELGRDYVLQHEPRLLSRLQAALRRVHELIFAPLVSHLSCKRLLLIPYGLIHRLPLHVLWDGAHYLLEHYECSYAPSASIAAYCRQRQHQAAPLQSWAGFAINDPSIPSARVEVEQAAHYFTHAHLYVDKAASRQGLFEAAARADVLHMATHGLFRPDNPFFSALKLADGWIDVRELYRLPLSARLVVLSACESGVGRLSGGDEVVGLARGFLGAGVHELVATLWNVHDATAADFMDKFYQYLMGASHHWDEKAGSGVCAPCRRPQPGVHPPLTQAAAVRPAAALRAAQCAALQSGQHPYYWASFFVIGV